MNRDEVDAIWDSTSPQGYGKSRYDIANDIEAAVVARQQTVLWCVTCDGDYPANVFPTRDLAEGMKAYLDAHHPGHKREIVPLVRGRT